jgi:hypothetical protein
MPALPVISIPNPVRQRVPLQIDSAPRTLAGLVPGLDAVKGRNRTLDFELNPAEAFDPAVRQTVENRVKLRRRSQGRPRPVESGRAQSRRHPSQSGIVRNSDAGYRVIQFLAIATADSLDEKVEGTIRPAGNPGPVTAPGTLKPVRSPHEICRLINGGLALLPRKGRTQQECAQIHTARPNIARAGSPATSASFQDRDTAGGKGTRGEIRIPKSEKPIFQ